ncbi:glycoside hydrolase family 2 protein [Ochrovirga pacifica]|uniref:glycoside hydrolase family 2 protein n=1 Tax=Ochrovirga pacifica TaxID=1042376 RepID=UPI000255A262|nr:glycoside hydrolase family 2 TIM barrel-domain containing protein [Ochrovirga pacifica]
MKIHKAIGLLISGLYTVFTAQSQNLNTVKQYLTGTDKDHTIAWDFYCSDGMQSKKWTKIEVPSCWELQGFGNYNYGRDYKAGKAYHNEYGIYKHQFTVPKVWKQREVKIVFEGVMTDAEVKINGQLAGEIHQGAFYEFKYNISKLLKYGAENQLEVKVHKMSANESINSAERNTDFWIFGGIYRPVYLEVLPKEHINRVAVDAKADGSIKADIFTDSRKATTVQVVLQDDLGNKIQDLKTEDISKEKGKISFFTLAKNIKTWNPEKPNMYQLKIELLDKKGKILHQIHQKIGFRTVEVRESDGIYVNNQKIKFKGVNRHSFYPESGRTTSKALSIEHINMIKDMNMNAVRMSHYPPDVHFLEACDSLGLFVIDEVCTWHVPYLDEKVGEKIIREAVVRDVNHPSIVLWANGNETGWNTKLDDDYAKWDIQQREVIHPWGIFGKTNTMHYPEYHIFAYDAPTHDKIYFPTEFNHGLYDGGHGASLDDYWKQMWNMPLSAGGFLWDFADEAVVRTDKGGVLDTDGNHAPDGIVGPYGEKEASYFTIKEIWSPIYLEERFIRDNFDGVFNVENRYHYTNLIECSMEAKWVKFKTPNSKITQEILVQQAVRLPNIAPLAKGKIKIEKPEGWKQADVLYLTAKDPNGMELFTWSYPVQKPKDINQKTIRVLSNKEKGLLKLKSTDQEIFVKTQSHHYTFSKATGLLKQVKKGKQIIPLHNGPILLGSKSEIENVEISSQKNKVVIRALYKAKPKYWDWKENKETTQDFFEWTIHANGMVSLHAEIRNIKMVKEYMGITFSFPENQVQGMKWLGDGPYRVWRNRMKGTRFQVWENDYNNTVTGESGFVYPEFKGFYANLNWVQVKGKNNNGFTVYCNSDNTFLRMLTPKAPKDPVKGAAVKEFPKGDISFVKNIPAIGTKFKEPIQMGPKGNPIHYFGNVDEMISVDLVFDF